MKKDVVVIILSLLALILIVFLLIMPGIDSLNLARTGFSFEESRLAEVQAQSQKLSALEKKYKDNPGELEKLTQALPKDQELAKLMINLENLATASGLIMDSVDFRAVEKKSSVNPPQMEEQDILPGKDQSLPAIPADGVQPPVQSYKTIAVSLKLAGGYDNFKNYLKSIEQNPRLMDVALLNYSSKSSQGLDSYSFSLDLNVYYQ